MKSVLHNQSSFTLIHGPLANRMSIHLTGTKAGLIAMDHVFRQSHSDASRVSYRNESASVHPPSGYFSFGYHKIMRRDCFCHALVGSAEAILDLYLQ